MRKCFNSLSATFAGRTEGWRAKSCYWSMGHLRAGSGNIDDDRSGTYRYLGGVEGISPDNDARIKYGVLRRRASSSSRQCRAEYYVSELNGSKKELKQCGDTLNEEDKRRYIELMYRLVKHPTDLRCWGGVRRTIHELPDGEINARSPYLEVKMMTEPMRGQMKWINAR